MRKMPNSKRPKAQKSNLIGKPIQVDWIDAWTGDALGFVSPEEAEGNEGIKQSSVGFCMASTPLGVTIARTNFSFGPDGHLEADARGKSFIPKGMIVRIKELR